MINYSIILTLNYPTKRWALYGESYDDFHWFEDESKPTKSELDALWPVAQTVSHNKRQQDARSNAYRNESDPLFFKWQRGEGTEQEWKDKVAEIQARYPYEGA